ncbi:NAD(P)-binding protein [Zopfia rhizophila CBS 207.26]|uniref:NAD(P)-binding protein n=1 Tax=Zopfia rhizophila CBS 207.26 TaxID=1314779 RepID=A0A6A6DHP9_9PEZI|nr:NAD(P)-binding protein [Zopfia rhizophila CBS 207.26]
MAPAFTISPEKRAGKLHFFYRQLFVTPPPVLPSQADLTGKTAIVTGANSGLGLETARQLLGLGCKVILAVRDEKKGETAREDLARSEKLVSASMIEVWKLDLSSYSSISDFAERVKGLDHLDIAILNAGLWKVTESFSTTGYEETIQVNYLSNVLLTLLLVPVIRDKKVGSDAGHIVVVNSDVASWAKFEESESKPLLPTFKQKMTKWNDAERYGTSKLLGQIFLSELAKHVPSSAVTVSFANCGLCRGSSLGRQFTGIARHVLDVMYGLIGRECGVGARTFVHAVTTLGQETHGQYIEDAKVQPMAPLAYTSQRTQVAKTLYEETMSELSFAGVQGIVNEFAGH